MSRIIRRQSGAVNEPLETGEEGLVIDALEKFPYVAFEDVAVPVHQFPHAFARRRGAFAFLAREAAGDEASGEEGLQQTAEGVVRAAVVVRCCADEAALRFVDDELTIFAGSPRSV
jgi:hypothetical protein